MCTLGGLHALGPLLASPSPVLRSGVANVLATASQNNPKVQSLCLSASLLPVLVHMVTGDPEDAVRLKALLALSCECARCVRA